MTALRSITLQSPGVLGLNTQLKDGVLDPRYCTEGDNCVIDRNGNLAARKGTKIANGTAATGAPTLDILHSYLQDNGTEIILSTGGSKVWSGTTTMTDVSTAVSVTADYWDFQNAQGNVIGCQAAHQPIWWDGSGQFEYLVDQNTQWATSVTKALGDIVVPTTPNGYYYECTTAGDTHGSTEPIWPTTIGNPVVDNTATWTTREIPKSNVLLYAFGRAWIADANGKTIYYSDLLIPSAFDTGFTTEVGSAGSINLDTVWPGSNDTITSLAVHNNNLIIFCENSIVIYSSADDVINLALVEVINSNGCVARDSVQTIGNDIFYLSNDGVRSLSRTVIQDNMPLTEISLNIRDDLVTSINSGTLAAVQSTYNDEEGFYLINFPAAGKTYTCDVRMPQTPRWLTWSQISMYGIVTGSDKTLRFGVELGYNASYTGYLDGDPSSGDTDLTYVLKYRSGWIDTGLQTSKAVWKKMIWYMSSEFDLQTSNTWGFDFLAREYSETKTVTGAPSAKWSQFQWSVDTWGSAFDKDRIHVNMRGTGSLIRIGTQLGVNNGKFAFNKLDLFFKTGRNR